MTGYQHPAYARSLAEFGTPRHLRSSDGWLLQRTIPGSAAQDAMGCYPVFACREWTALGEDLDAASDLVSIVLVADPFGQHTRELLEHQFDLVRPFKQHFVTEYRAGAIDNVSRHHRYHARRALREVEVERCEDPRAFLDDWCVLYEALVQRHQLTGIKAFSRTAFALQLRVPGTVIFRAVHGGRTIAAHWYYVQGDVCYSHLAAQNDEGYARSAAYALHWHALHAFSRDVRWLTHGAAAGALDSSQDGLVRFKRGWSNACRTAYLCGRIPNRGAYERLMQDRSAGAAHYFPLYREGELA
ncbi:hypothetical protein BH23GEM9_BH23GEM9_23410 [soil metagenome]